MKKTLSGIQFVTQRIKKLLFLLLRKGNLKKQNKHRRKTKQTNKQG